MKYQLLKFISPISCWKKRLRLVDFDRSQPFIDHLRRDKYILSQRLALHILT